MTSTFTFKLDPASLPKLSSRGENFTEWKSAWTITFLYAGLWPIVSGKLCGSTMSSAISFGDANRGFQAGITHGPVNTTFRLPLGTSQENPRIYYTDSDQALMVAPPRTTGDSTTLVGCNPVWSRHRLHRGIYSIGSKLNALHQAHGPRLLGWAASGKVDLSAAMDNQHCKASRSLPSNWHTEYKSDRPKSGCSRFTQATRRGLSRAIAMLQTASRCLGGRIPKRTYFLAHA